MKLNRKPQQMELDIMENNRIGINLAKLRFMNALTQTRYTELIQLCGLDIDRATLSLIEHGKRKLLVYEIPFFAKALKMSVGEFTEKILVRE